MRIVLLALLVTGTSGQVVLAQRPVSPSAPASTWSDGPLLGPAVNTAPVVSTPPAAAPGQRPDSAPVASGPQGNPSLEAPIINIPDVEERVLPPSEQGGRSQSKKLPKLFRLPKPNGDSGATSSGKSFMNRWKKNPLDEAPLASPEVSGVTPLDERQVSAGSATAKKSTNTRRYGPLEILPKTKEGDRTGNPFSIRRPVLAW